MPFLYIDGKRNEGINFSQPVRILHIIGADTAYVSGA